MRFFLLLCLLLPLAAQAQILVSGRLVDERQQPVPYASVALADGRSGTASNEVGEFILRVPALPQQLTVLSIGFERTVIAVAQAGPLPAAVVLKASAVALPEVTVRANGEAEELVRRCYAKLLRHEADVQYGRGFYRQKTRENGRYREFFDAFYDVKITPRNMPSWVLGEARYALTPGGLTMSNFSMFTRLLPLFQASAATAGTTLVPFRADGLANFTFVLRQTLREQGRELAVVDFAPRPGTKSVLKGTLYIDPRTAAVFRMEQDMPVSSVNFSSPNYHVENMTLRLTTDFVAENDSLTRIASARNVMTINATVKGFADETIISSYFLVYEYGAPTPGQQYPNTDPALVDLAGIKKRRYNPQFWRDNAVIKSSPIENGIIEDFEGQKVFGKLN
jgi:hypothetical protein